MTTTRLSLYHFFSLLIVASSSLLAAPGDITTIAGNGNGASSGDGDLATAAGLFHPFGLAVDTEGNVYIADFFGHAIRKVDSATGLISTVVGTGTGGYNGDGMIGTETQINGPTAIEIGPDKLIYFVDFYNNRIRQFDPETSIVSTFLGTGVSSFNGDGMHRTTTNINSGDYFSFFPNGDLLFVSSNSFRVRRVDASTGIVTAVLGDGTQESSGDGGPAIDAKTFLPFSSAVDRQGNIYIAEFGRIRRIDSATGIVATIVGDGIHNYSGDGGDASLAQVHYPRGMLFDEAGNLFFCDESNNRVRRIDAITNIITSVAGDGVADFSGDEGPASSAGLHSPNDIAVDREGNLFIVEFGNNRVRKVEGAAVVYQRTADASIGKNARRLRGAGIVNTSGAGQTLSIKSRKKKALRFSFLVRNRGGLVDSMDVTASRAPRKFRAKYVRSGSGNVTAALRTGYRAVNLPIDSAARFTASVKPKFRKGRKTARISILSKSASHDDKRDLIRAKLMVKLPR